MYLSIFLPPGVEAILIQARAEGPGRTLGHLTREIRPGDSFLGWSYDELRALGNGMHELQPKPGWSQAKGIPAA